MVCSVHLDSKGLKCSDSEISNLTRLFLKYGPNTRLCMELWSDSTAEAGHELKISRALANLPQTSSWLPNPDDWCSSRVLFSILPETKTSNTIAFPYPTSPYIA